jgi:glycosyltransferase involved in cell wall biosynthesis
VRILYILTSLGVGGAERQVIAVAERMAARGHSVAFVVLKHAEEECPIKLPVLRLNLRKTPLGVLRGLRFAHKFLLLFRPDILHSHTFPANIFARLLRIALYIKVNMGGTVPVVINTIHNVYEGGWHRMLLYRLTGAQADAVTAVSAAAAERFIQLGAVYRSKISVLTNGIDIASFTPDNKTRRSKRAETQAGGAFVWLAVGRIVPAKDYPNLLCAFAQVRRVHATAALWIAGEGSVDSLVDDSNEHDQMKAVNVQWLGLRRDIPSLLAAADGYVLSSAWEGMPLAVGEAMAMEKPVVATDVGGVRELVGDAGIVVPPADSEALANAMLELMAMTEKQRKEMGRAARERIKQHFSIETKAEEWEQMYLHLKRQETE